MYEGRLFRQNLGPTLNALLSEKQAHVLLLECLGFVRKVGS